jgi:type IV fimbrial biogenesis protein FimT
MDRLSAVRSRGFTLVELLVTIAVTVLLLSLAAPSFTQLIAQQRLRSINAEVVTALQYARSEAVARNTSVQIQLGSSSSMTCYMVLIQAGETDCDCTRTPGSACVSGLGTELHTTQVPRSTDVQVVRDPAGVLPMSMTRDGVLDLGVSSTSFAIRVSRISGASGRLQTTVSPTGRPTVCSPDSSVTGVPAC